MVARWQIEASLVVAGIQCSGRVPRTATSTDIYHTVHEAFPCFFVVFFFVFFPKQFYL